MTDETREEPCTGQVFKKNWKRKAREAGEGFDPSS